MINVNKASNQVLQALLRVREPGNEALITLLQDEFEGAKQKLVYASDMELIHRLQGRAEAFEDLLKAIDESRKAQKAR